MNKQIGFMDGDEQLLDEVKPLWEKLNEHHRKISQHFSDKYEQNTFARRKEGLLRKQGLEGLRIDIAKDMELDKKIGYCISTITKDKVGEIDSIYVDSDYRDHAIGEALMKRAIQWMDDVQVVKKVLNVADGNEQVFHFYKKFGFYPQTTILEQKNEG